MVDFVGGDAMLRQSSSEGHPSGCLKMAQKRGIRLQSRTFTVQGSESLPCRFFCIQALSGPVDVIGDGPAKSKVDRLRPSGQVKPRAVAANGGLVAVEVDQASCRVHHSARSL